MFELWLVNEALGSWQLVLASPEESAARARLAAVDLGRLRSFVRFELRGPGGAREELARGQA